MAQDSMLFVSVYLECWHCNVGEGKTLANCVSLCSIMDADDVGNAVGAASEFQDSAHGDVSALFHDEERYVPSAPLLPDVQLADFEGREVVESETESDEEVATDDDKKFVIWKHELRLAAKEEAADMSCGRSTRHSYLSAKEDLVPMSTGKLPRDLTDAEKL